MFSLPQRNHRLTVGRNGSFLAQDAVTSTYYDAGGQEQWSIDTPTRKGAAATPQVAAIADGVGVLADCLDQRCVYRGIAGSGKVSWQVEAAPQSIGNSRAGESRVGDYLGSSSIKIAARVVPLVNVQGHAADQLVTFTALGQQIDQRTATVAGVVDNLVVTRAGCELQGVRDGQNVW